MLHTCSLVGFVSMAVLANAAVVDIDFNQGNELSSRFNQTSITPFTQVLNGGVGNSGAVSVSGQSKAVYNVAPFNFSTPGSSVSGSLFFQFNNYDLPPSTSLDAVVLGFTDEATGTIGGQINAISVGVNVYADGPFAGPHLQTDFGSSGFISPTVLDLIAGHWYRLSGTFLNQDGVVMSMTVAVDHYGADGSTLVGPGSSMTRSKSVDGALLSDSTTWLAFEALNAAGVTMLDNLTVVPEPGSSVLFALGLTGIGLGCAMRRERRS
jgi:hypothetical protein